MKIVRFRHPVSKVLEQVEIMTDEQAQHTKVFYDTFNAVLDEPFEIEICSYS